MDLIALPEYQHAKFAVDTTDPKLHITIGADDRWSLET